MKKLLFSALALFVCLSINAQIIEIYKNGGANPVLTLVNDSKTSYQIVMKENPYNYSFVDLGLPSGTLWATMNVGASKPEDSGDYFAWGETTGYKSGKTNFDWTTYKYCSGTYTTMTKYCINSSEGTVDNKTVLETEDDAAIANWGSSWRMPTNADYAELINSTYTTTTWTTQGGVNGYLITSKSNGNSIFLPVAGYRNGSELKYSAAGYYWSSSLSSFSNDAYGCNLNSEGIQTSIFYRCNGLSVRPVRNLSPILSLNKSKDTIEVGNTVTLTPTILNSSATVVTWTSSNTTIASVEDGVVSGLKAGNATIYCQLDGTTAKDSCVITVISLDTHQYIDLGLPSGTKWATCNVGASKPEDYGDYFAWGETAGYNSGKTNFDWSTYKYCNGTYNSLTKYCADNSYGTVDDKTVLDPEDDAATANWGSNWRMPTYDEYVELINSSYTTTTWTTQGGVNGRLITSRSNGDSIFLPAAGCRNGTNLDNAGFGGDYWSSTLYLSYCFNARLLFFSSNRVGTLEGNRHYGQSVRPVHQ